MDRSERAHRLGFHLKAILERRSRLSMVAVVARPLDFIAAWRVVRSAAVVDIPRAVGRRRGRRERLAGVLRVPVFSVLVIPCDLTELERGRSRQAMRTNVRRAQTDGYYCELATDAGERMSISAQLCRQWGQPVRPLFDHPHTVVVTARARDGELSGVASAVVVNRLAFMSVFVRVGDYAPVRYFMHRELVHELAQRAVSWLLADDWYGSPAGVRYFQERVGFAPRRVRWTAVNEAEAMRNMTFSDRGQNGRASTGGVPQD